MNFMEALKAIKEGNVVKRKGTHVVQYWDNQNSMISYDEEGYTFRRFNEGRFNIKDYEATDWELVDEEKDWNLAKLFEDISYGGWKSNIDVVGKISVKKCRDLIVKDVQEHADLNHYHEAMRAHIHHIVEIIERRFGDL